MKVLLFEQWWGGHHINYLECLVPRLARTVDKVVVAVEQRMLDSPQAMAWRQLDRVEFAPTLPPGGPGLTARDRLDATRNLLQTLETVRPDITLLPSADAQASFLALWNRVGQDRLKRYGPVEGTMHFGYGYSASNAKGRLKELVYSQTVRHVPFSALNFVSFTYFDYLVEHGVTRSKRVRFVGDPVPQPAPIGQRAARELLGVDPVGTYLGFLGMLDRRKAVPELLAAFRAADLPADHRLLLAGRLNPDYAALIRDDYQSLVDQGRLIVHDRYLSEAEIRHGYEALDLATVVYGRFPGLASLGLKAIAAGTPVLADDFGWLRSAVRRFDVGRCVDIFDTPRFAAALRDAVGQPRGWRQPEAVRRLMAFHSEDNFTSLMCQGVDQRLGSGSPAPLIEWPWVMEGLPPERRHLN